MTQLDGLYSDNPNTIQVQFDGKQESLDRMQSALTEPLMIIDRETGKPAQTIMTKEEFLQNKQFHIRMPPSGTPLKENFEALFSQHKPNLTISYI